MKAVFLRGFALFLAICIAGCTTAGPGPVQVTRFHLQQPIARGQIAIEPMDPRGAQGLEFRSYQAALARQLTSQGWAVVDTVGQSEQVALLDVRRGSVDRPHEPGPVSVGVGGGSGGYGSGVGMGVGFNLGGRSGPRVTTEIDVRIKRRSDGTVFWEGRASSDEPAKSADANRAAAVERLAEGLFRDFPGNQAKLSGSNESLRLERF